MFPVPENTQRKATGLPKDFTLEVKAKLKYSVF